MMGDIIVWASAALAAVFFLAWLLHPGLRAFIERPKHRFQDDVREYDRRRVREHHRKGGSQS